MHTWVEVLVEGAESNTWISNVFVVTLDTGINLPLIGSVARGYVWSVAWLSWSQRNVNELSTTLIRSLFSRPWLARVNVKRPVVGLYAAAVGVKLVVLALGYACTLA